MTDETTPGTDLTVIEVAGITVPLMSTENAGMAILERIVEATSWQDALNAAKSADANDIDGRPFLLREVQFYPSDFEDGPGCYAILHVDFVDDGTKSVVTCGGTNVVGQLLVFAKYGLPDIAIKLKKNDKPTSNGFYPLWLHAA